ncbi:MAG: hypothetical protein M1819_004942 [Sarea resinae]|nr:MAG: hypothetical protein M1819_004942 [Sarea resinae]
MPPNFNSTPSAETPQWNSKPMLHLPLWVEPVVVVSILFGAMFLTRRRDFHILGGSKSGFRKSVLDDPADPSSEDILLYDSDNEDDAQDPIAASRHLPKRRSCCCFTIQTPNTSRFANNVHSRVLQKFPFLIEMFYWVINYLFYRMTMVLSQKIFSARIWDVAIEHGVAVLRFEHESWLSFLFALKEVDVQQWFMHGHQDGLTMLNRAYALIHIPGTVGFIAWYYYIAPSHPTFATVRRTMTLTNFLAFATFVFYPCMPPRLLPPEYGFVDSVRHANAQSIWMSGKYVNSLAAMPSMHFGYAFCIGSTMLYHSGIFRRTLERGETRKSWPWKIAYLTLGLGYPLLVLTAIVATANHYWMDPLMATILACVAYYFNRVWVMLLPLEDMLFWALRMEKPIPSTGERFRERGGSL